MKRLLVGLALGGAVVRVLAGCMIDLDAVPGPVVDAGFDAPPDVGPPPVDDAGSDAGVACTVAADCDTGPFGGGCLTPQCNAGRCTYDLCPTGDACQIARCDLDAGACSAPSALAFGAGQLAISTNAPFANLPCGALGRCVAAGYPFVFVVDGQDSISGYVVADPKATTPRRVGVDKLDFAPAALLGNENRIYFVGAPSGPLQDMRLRIGWLEVPANPFASDIPVTSVEIPYRASSGDVPQLFAAPGGDLFLVSGRESFRFRPTSTQATLVRPLPDNASLGIATSAADRLVGVASDGAGSSAFALLVNAGTATAGFGGAVAGPANVAQVTTAGGPAGEVVALAAIGPVVDGGIPLATRTRVQWVVEPGATTITSDAGVDFPAYAGAGVATTSRLVGPVAVTSAGAVTFRASGPTLTTNVELVARRDAGRAPAANAQRSGTLPGAPGSYVALASRDWVYALSAAGTTLTVDVFRPSCDT